MKLACIHRIQGIVTLANSKAEGENSILRLVVTQCKLETTDSLASDSPGSMRGAYSFACSWRRELLLERAVPS